ELDITILELQSLNRINEPIENITEKETTDGDEDHAAKRLQKKKSYSKTINKCPQEADGT
ncbi:21_t:CDS:1, partial [Acaulospora colombiana]